MLYNPPPVSITNKSNDEEVNKSPSNYSVEVIKTYNDFKQLECIWNELLSDSPTDTYFMRWEWISNWWDIYAQSSDELNIIVVRDNDTIVCIAPFFTRKKYLFKFYPFKVLMFLGTQDTSQGDVCSVYSDLIYRIDNSDKDKLFGLVLEQVVNRIDCDKFYFSRVDVNSASIEYLLNTFNDRGLERYTKQVLFSPYINLPDNWDAYMQSISASMRYKIRREQRKFERNFKNISFRKTADQDGLSSDYATLVNLHQSWWGSRGVVGSFSDSNFHNFHKIMTRTMLDNDHLDLSFIENDGESLAAIYLIKYEGKIYYYQSGISEANRNVALGYIMHAYCIEDAIDSGFTEYDFLPDSDFNSYKTKYTKIYKDVEVVYFYNNRLLAIHEKSFRILRKLYKHLFRSKQNQTEDQSV
ncbi:MAG: GNAT family N-acetyltransferase [Candidatus Thiodiazotropha lotti]|nr:GNAT family N-acetyltransferase [Candidatus Thiodiazotropha lotti]